VSRLTERQAQLVGWAVVVVAVVGSRFVGDVPKWIILGFAVLGALGLLVAAIRGRLRM
jgi:hypothetical protein